MPRILQVTVRKGIHINLGNFENCKHETEVVLQPELGESFEEVAGLASGMAGVMLWDEARPVFERMHPTDRKLWLERIGVPEEIREQVDALTNRDALPEVPEELQAEFDEFADRQQSEADADTQARGEADDHAAHERRLEQSAEFDSSYRDPRSENYIPY